MLQKQQKTARFGTPCGNRTHNGPLGGGCYIHLTKEANIKFLLTLCITVRNINNTQRTAHLYGKIHFSTTKIKFQSFSSTFYQDKI